MSVILQLSPPLWAMQAAEEIDRFPQSFDRLTTVHKAEFMASFCAASGMDAYYRTKCEVLETEKLELIEKLDKLADGETETDPATHDHHD